MFTLNCVWVNKTAQGKGNDEAWMTGQFDILRKMARWDVVADCQMLTQTIIQTYKHIQRGKRGQGEGTSEKKHLRTCTSILRPSTTVPCNFSLALSASTLCSNVTNPKPCMQDRKKQEQHAHYFFLYISYLTIQ